MMINRLILRLPPEFAGREQRLGHAIAAALAAHSTMEGFSQPHLALAFKDISPLMTDDRIAAQVASRISAQVKVVP
jgi:hypothetical protein